MYQVFKGVGGKYTICNLTNNTLFNAVPRGSLKKNGKILVGDFVEIENNNFNENEKIISKVLTRKNSLIRPPLSNIDQLVIVLAPVPKPDYYLIDKLLLTAYINSIEPLIIINKCDLDDNSNILEIYNNYKDACNNVIICSADKNINIPTVKEKLQNKFNVFAGQSAVGKSSLLNALSNNTFNLKTNGLSEKIERGKHTTRHSEIYSIGNNILIADTPGFSMLELNNLNPADINLFYPDFDNFREDCKFKNCAHINCSEKDCAIVKAVNEGKINKDRYNRYLDLYKIYLENWRNKYD